jgi:flagella basal body P-ring formation protein FlgA
MLSFGAGSARAAEFRLRAQCQSAGSLVTLGDVAEIFATDRQQTDALAAIELFPAPPATRERHVQWREIQDLLLLRGINLAEHRFSGSSQVTILGHGEPARTDPDRPLSFTATRAATSRVREAIVHYLKKQVSAESPWVVEVELEESHARILAGPNRGVSVGGGARPWTGVQRFEMTVDTPDGPVRFPLHAEVSLLPAVVVAAKALPSGVLIRAADIELQQVPQHETRTGGFLSIDEVIGKETTQTIAKGKTIQPKQVRSPLLVRRGEVVTVCARSPGICVRTMGRARQNGSLGELIAVESLLDRQTYFASVSKLREVEVFARSIKADQTDTGRRAPLSVRTAGHKTRKGIEREASTY